MISPFRRNRLLWHPLPNSIQSGEPAKTAPGQTNQGDAPADNTGRRGEATPPDTEGRDVPSSAPEGATTLPLLGVAVDTGRPVTQSDLQLAKRHQAMAALSGEIGDAAARASNPAVVPASMVPTEGETTGATDAEQDPVGTSSGVSKSMALDMPAATVGPLSLRLAAANGDPSAEFEVGARFAESKGMPQNFKEAAKWYQLSADHGVRAGAISPWHFLRTWVWREGGSGTRGSMVSTRC